MGREVSYEWGALGECRKTVYPDGQSVSFEYDDLSRLIRLKDGKKAGTIFTGMTTWTA